MSDARVNNQILKRNVLTIICSQQRHAPIVWFQFEAVTSETLPILARLVKYTLHPYVYVALNTLTPIINFWCPI